MLKLKIMNVMNRNTYYYRRNKQDKNDDGRDLLHDVFVLLIMQKKTIINTRRSVQTEHKKYNVVLKKNRTATMRK